jgi:hypothetical protein
MRGHSCKDIIVVLYVDALSILSPWKKNILLLIDELNYEYEQELSIEMGNDLSYLGQSLSGWMGSILIIYWEPSLIQKYQQEHDNSSNSEPIQAEPSKQDIG